MAQTVHYTAPPRTPLEAFEMFPEGTRAELIDNVIYMPPAPSIEHQRASLKLSTQIDMLLSSSENGEVFLRADRRVPGRQ